MTRLGVVCVALLGILLSACASTPCAVDIQEARADGRTRFTPPPIARTWGRRGVTSARLYRPGSGTCTLIRHGQRLLIPVRDERGRLTEFVYDTGTSLTLVSACAPITDRIKISPSTKVSTGRREGIAGLLPRLQLGTIVCSDVPVAVIDQRHHRAEPTNLLGGIPLTGLLLCHTSSNDRWWLRRNAGASPIEGRNVRTVSLLQPGLPVVKMRTVSGDPVYALIDTGAPTTHAATRSGLRGEILTLVDDAGTALFDIRPTHEIDWKMDVAGTPIDIYLGLPDLARLTFELDIDSGVWHIADPENSP